MKHEKKRIISLFINRLLTIHNTKQFKWGIRIPQFNCLRLPIHQLSRSNYQRETTFALEKMLIRIQGKHRQLVCGKCVTPNRNSVDAHVAFKGTEERAGLRAAILNCVCMCVCVAHFYNWQVICIRFSFHILNVLLLFNQEKFTLGSI